MCGDKVQLPLAPRDSIVLAPPASTLGGAEPQCLAHCHKAMTSVEIVRRVRVSADVFSGTQGSGYRKGSPVKPLGSLHCRQTTYPAIPSRCSPDAAVRNAPRGGLLLHAGDG
jgi:hypothetical protein